MTITEVATDPQASIQVPTFDTPVRFGSPHLGELLAYIDAGVVDRDRRQDRHPFEEFEVIRAGALGALRLPVSDGGGGATLRQLFETVIALGEVDPNVAHSVRNHFNFTESLLRRRLGWTARWLDEVQEQASCSEPRPPNLSRKQAGRRNRDFETAITDGPDGLRLTGAKFYSAGNLYADFLVVSATGPDGETVRVVVPADRDGVCSWTATGTASASASPGSGTTSYRERGRPPRGVPAPGRAVRRTAVLGDLPAAVPHRRDRRHPAPRDA